MIGIPVFLGLLLLVKLLLAPWLPFVHDEAYYCFWAENLRLSYFDHPGMVAWLFKVGRETAPFAQAARWPFVVLGHFTIVIWWWLYKEKLSVRSQWLLIAALCLHPLVGIGSFVATPDVPLLFFFSLSFAIFQHILREPRRLLGYVLLGVSLGLGFCSKYHIVLFVPMCLLQVFVQNHQRRIRWPYVLITIFTGLMFCAPVWVWNILNDFQSFKFQLSHGLSAQKWSPLDPIHYVFAQVMIVGPFLIFSALKHKLRAPRNLAIWIGFPFAFFLISSFRAPVEGNWTAMAYPPLMAWLVGALPDKSSALKWTLGTWVLGLTLTVSEILHPWLPGELTRWKVRETREYAELAQLLPTLPQPLYASSYQMASQLRHLSGRPVFKVYGMARRDFFDELPEAVPQAQEYYVVVNHQWSWETPLDEQGHKKVDRVQILPEFDLLTIRQGGLP